MAMYQMCYFVKFKKKSSNFVEYVVFKQEYCSFCESLATKKQVRSEIMLYLYEHQIASSWSIKKKISVLLGELGI